MLDGQIWILSRCLGFGTVFVLKLSTHSFLFIKNKFFVVTNLYIYKAVTEED